MGIPKELSQSIVETWVKQTEDWFDYADLDRELGVGSASGKTARRVICDRFVKAGLLRRHPNRKGTFRLVIDDASVIDWQNADTSNIVDILWPFDLQNLVTIYPKNVIVIAGSFNSGKTAFCLNVIELNQHREKIKNLLPIQYFNSEMGAEEMKLRLGKFGPVEWNFIARERSSNFSDVIKPDKLNIIDYLEVGDNFYLVGEELSEIFNRLGKGIAIVALQKKRGAEMGRGAEFSVEKARLYLSMDNNLLRIVKAKNWATEGDNPNGKKFRFKLSQGCRFSNIEEEY